ncbi:MAG TPA: TonB-dependent receptor [Longimicrobiales bacterium]
MHSPISLALLAILVPLQEPAPGIVRGQVRSEATSSPVPGARVELVGVPGAVVIADSAGRYVLRGVPPGRRTVRASHIDHDGLQVEVLVPAGAEFLLDFVLQVRPVTLPRVTAHALAVRAARDTLGVAPPELEQASIRALESTPGVAELGIAEAVKQFPRGEPVDPADILYVRGTAADLKLMLLDGAPVYAPYHLSGLIRPFEAGLLQSATLYLGGAPARYDGGLSYILELETRAARRSGVHASGSMDVLSAAATVEGPITGGVAYLAGARALHGLGMQYLLSDGFPYGYADALARVDAPVGSYGSVSVTGFWNYESVDLDTAHAGADPARWGNAAASVRYRGALLGGEAELTASHGVFAATMPVGDKRPIVARGQSRRTRLSADYGRDLGAAFLRFGVTHDRLELDQQLEPRGLSGSLSIDVLREVARGDVTGAYVDASFTPTKRLVLRGGLRADAFSLQPGLRLAPRIGATWLPTDRLVVRLTAGRYRQYVSVPEALDERVVWTPNATLRTPLVVARASHVVLGLDREIGYGIRLGLESFVKRFEGLPSHVAPALRSEPPRPNTETEMNVSGVDLWLQRSTGRLQGWLGYSVAWIWADGNGYTLTQAADGRQLVSAGLSGPIGAGGEFEVRLSYGAGLPYTAVPEVATPDPGLSAAAAQFPMAFLSTESPEDVGPVNRLDGEPYLRLDAQVSHTWDTQFRGTRVEVTPYLRVLNALDRRDALFYRSDGDGGLQPVGVLPVVPVLGVAWRF